MIVVKLELWPRGDASRAQDLGKAIIINESGLGLSTYSVRLLKGARYSARPGTLYRSGTVPGFPRSDSRWGPWELLALALEATVGDRIEGLKRHLHGASLAQVQEWQPIDSAPRDGQRVLLGWFPEAGGSSQEVAFWHSVHDTWFGGGRRLKNDGYFSPTHWMPLPARPASAGCEATGTLYDGLER